MVLTVASLVLPQCCSIGTKLIANRVLASQGSEDWELLSPVIQARAEQQDNHE